MKKGLTFFATLAALALGLVGCKPGGGDGKTYNVSITNKAALAEIYDDDNSKSVSVQIEGVITGDAYAAHDLVVTSSDESVMTINGNNRLRPVAAGNVTVKATYKHKFSDSVDIRVVARPALRIATSLSESGEYLLATPLTSGRVYSSAHMATGGAKFYISGSTDMGEAAQAKVVLNSSATDDYKWEIHLQDPDSEDVKVLGTAANENNGWHYNLGFVGDVVPDTEIAYQKAYFKLTAAPQFGLETVVTYDTDKTATLLVGTQTGKTTMSLGDTTKVVPAHLYEMGEPIPATAVTVSPKTPDAGRPGETIQLTATLTPETSSDTVTWSSDNRDVADVDETGLVTLKANGTAHITAQARPNVTDTATVTCSGEALNFGTKDQPLTVEQASALLDVFGDNVLTSQKMFVRGVVSESAAINQNRREIWLQNSDASVAKAFDVYSCQNTEFPTLPTAADALVGYTITVTGWGVKYVNSAGTKTVYEFTNKDASGNYDNPEIVAYVAAAPAELTGVSVTPSTASVDVASGQQTKQFTASPVPSNATLGSVTWTVVDEPAGVSVSASGLVTVAQSAVEEDATKTVTIKATAGGFNGTATLTITRSTSGGGGETTVAFAISDFTNASTADFTVANATVSGISVAFTKVKKATYSGHDHFRVTKANDSTMTITGGTITKVEFVCELDYTSSSGTSYYGAGSGFVAGAGTLGADVVGASSQTATWTGSSTSLVFTASGHQVRIISFVVTVAA